MSGLEFRSSALKRFSEDDIRHALRNAVRVIPAEGFDMVVGSVSTGALIEVGLREEDDEIIVFHAMPARPKFLR